MKRRAVEVFLVLFAVWPLFQHLLVRTYDVDSWKLFGWAMYAAPGPMKTVRLVLIDADGAARRLALGSYSEEEQRLVDRFRARRRALGRLESADGLARGMLDIHPEAAGVFIPVLSFAVDRQTALLDSSIESSTHWRDGRDTPFAIPDNELKRLFGP